MFPPPQVGTEVLRAVKAAVPAASCTVVLEDGNATTTLVLGDPQVTNLLVQPLHYD